MNEKLTGLERAKIVDHLSLFKRDHDEIVDFALDVVIYQKGADHLSGALGLSWAQCRRLWGVDKVSAAGFDPLKREIFDQAFQLWSCLPLEELEAISLQKSEQKEVVGGTRSS